MRNHARVSKRAAVPGDATINRIGRVLIVNSEGDSENVTVSDPDTIEVLRLQLREMRAQSEMMVAAFNIRDPVKAFRDAEERALN